MPEAITLLVHNSWKVRMNKLTAWKIQSRAAAQMLDYKALQTVTIYFQCYSSFETDALFQTQLS